MGPRILRRFRGPRGMWPSLAHGVEEGEGGVLVDLRSGTRRSMGLAGGLMVPGLGEGGFSGGEEGQPP